MTDKVTLTDLANLQNETTAVTAINNNNAAITTAMDNTLSRDGTSPNAMGAALDMNSNQIVNLPAPTTELSPLRFKDLNDFLGGTVTFTNLPTGGATNAVLAKNSSTNYDAGWTNTPTFTSLTTGAITASGAVNKVTITPPASSATLTLANGKSLTVNNILTLAGTDGTTITFQGTGTYVSRTSSDTLTNKTFDTASNTFKLNGTTITTISDLTGTITHPTVQRFTSGSGTYTAPAGVKNLRVRMIAGAGGGGAGITNNGANGGDTSFGSWTAIHGQGGTHGTAGSAAGSGGTGGTGGATGTGTLINRITGSNGAGGSLGSTSVTIAGGAGGVSCFGGAGEGNANNNGSDATTNSGSGGGGGSILQDCTGGGGGAGEFVEFWVTSPANVSYAVGAGGAGGAAGTKAGGAGAAGIIIVEEFYV